MTNVLGLHSHSSTVLNHPMIEISDYESWLLATGASAATVIQRTRFARARLREWGRLDVPPVQLATFLAQHHGWTRVTYHAALLSLYEWAEETGRVASNPIRKMKRAPRPRPNPKPMTADEQARVLEAANDDMRLILQLAFLAGLRRFEIAKLRGEEVTERTFAFTGKGGQFALIPTHPDLWELLQDRPRTGWVFPSPQIPGRPLTASALDQRVRRHFRRHGVPGGIHRARATYGTNLLRQGTNIRVVQQLMRHASLSSTEHYLGVADDELGRAIRGLAA